jgi:signal transduction histidine kinase
MKRTQEVHEPAEQTERLVGNTAYLLANQVSSSLDPEDVLDSIVRILKQVLNCRGSVIFLFDENREWLEMRASCGVKPRWQRSARMRMGEGISGQVAQDAKPLYIPDATLEPNFIVFDPAVRSLFVVPLIHKGEVIGTLNVDDVKPNAFSGDVGRLLTIAGAQAAAAIANAQLYKDLQERADKLAQAHRELQESDRLKSEFVQNTSHELRTPLTFIKAYVELLLNGDLGRLTDQQQISLRVVAEWTNKLVQLVDSTLAIQAIERGDLEFGPIDLAAVARSAIQSASAVAQQTGLSLATDLSPDLAPVWGDRLRLEQVFVNLIGNACKFSPDGGTITVRLQNATCANAEHIPEPSSSHPRRWVRADVIDQGIGIAPDQLTRIFERFYQIDGSSRRRFGGTGLGLAIVQEIIQAHGGTIAVDSQVGVGSRFSFTVPTAAGASNSGTVSPPREGIAHEADPSV